MSSVPTWPWHILPPAQTTVASVPTAQCQAGTWQCSAHSTKRLCSLCWFPPDPISQRTAGREQGFEDSRSGHCLQASLLGALGRRQVQERRGSRRGDPSSHVPEGLKLSFLNQFRQNNSSCLQARKRCGEPRALMGRQAGWEGRERGREGDPIWKGEGFELADLSS